MYMPTEGEIIPIERDIQQLLNESTYQGMTDTEIRKIIDYYSALARMEGESSEMVTVVSALEQNLQQLCQQASEQSSAMVQSALNMSIPWVRITSEGTVISNV